MDWIFIVVIAIIVIGILYGVYRGAIRIAVSLATTLITLLVVVFVTPLVADAVIKYTPLDETIESYVSSVVTSVVSDTAAAETEASEGALNEEQVREAMEESGVTEEDLQAYGITVDDVVKGDYSNLDLPAEMQDEAIETAQIPEAFKNLLTKNNNSETYEQLGVASFADYVGSFLAKLIVNILSFLGLFLIVTIILRAIVFALDFVSELPVLGAVNRVAGGAVGLVIAMIIIWFLFMIVAIFFATSWGGEIYNGIQGNAFTRFLFNNNPIMSLAVRF